MSRYPDPSCVVCGKPFVMPGDEDYDAEFPLYATVLLTRDCGDVLLPGLTHPVRMRDTGAIVCSPACFQAVLDDPAWTRLKRRRPT